MPNISSIPIPLYQPLDPYQHDVDNRPIIALERQISVVNTAVNNNTQTLYTAAGSAGSIGNRINQSLDEFGNIKVEAVNSISHSIEDHVDTEDYVRMEYLERAKLSLISPGATSLKINFSTISGVYSFTDETINIAGSDSIKWNFSGTDIFATTNFPESVRHVHYYGLTPVHQDLITPDYQNYLVTSVATPYQSGSLRVFINGFRLNPNEDISIGSLSISYTEDASNGAFTLSTPISISYSIMVDFNVLY